MPCRWLLRVRLAGEQPGEELAQLSLALQGLQAIHVGPFCASVTTHRRVQETSHSKNAVTAAKDLTLVTFKSQPEVLHLILRQERKLVTASQDMLNLLNRLGLYKQRSLLLCEGSEFHLGDFIVHLCRAILKPGDEVRGLMLDIRYQSRQSGQQSQQALEEFMAALHEASAKPLCDLVLVEAPIEEYGLTEASEEQVAAIQYVAYAASLTQWQQ